MKNKNRKTNVQSKEINLNYTYYDWLNWKRYDKKFYKKNFRLRKTDLDTQKINYKEWPKYIWLFLNWYK